MANNTEKILTSFNINEEVVTFNLASTTKFREIKNLLINKKKINVKDNNISYLGEILTDNDNEKRLKQIVGNDVSPVIFITKKSIFTSSLLT